MDEAMTLGDIVRAATVEAKAAGSEDRISMTATGPVAELRGAAKLIRERVAAYLAAVRQREQAAIRGPWTLETDHVTLEGDDNWEFPHGIRMPEPHTTHADREHCDWDYLYSELCQMTIPTAEFLVAARSDVSRLLGAVEAVLALADDWASTQGDGPGYIAVRACGIRVRSVIAAELLKEG